MSSHFLKIFLDVGGFREKTFLLNLILNRNLNMGVATPWPKGAMAPL